MTQKTVKNLPTGFELRQIDHAVEIAEVWELLGKTNVAARMRALIGIGRHGTWSEQSMVQVLHDNWPASIERARARGIFASKERRVTELKEEGDKIIAALEELLTRCH